LLYQLGADLLVIIHLAFIVFVIVGSIAVLRWPWLVLLHIPAAIWGAVVVINGWLCPLTPWENSLRHLAGLEGYSGGFIEYYIIPLIYPMDITHNTQVLIGVIMVVVNLFLYGFVIFRLIRKGAVGNHASADK
jgi:small-conductance mechanosensitive channel